MTSKLANVTRAALGRAAKIGALYDVRTESFLDDTLFASTLDDDTIDTMDLGDSAIELVMSDSLQEKCSKLNVEAQLQVSLCAGIVKLSGSGAYLEEERKSARAQSMSLIYKLRTVNDEFMIRQNKNKIDMDLLTDKSTDATHVVVGIDWGAVCSITCEYENIENEDTTEVKGALSAEIKMLILDVKGSAKVSYEDKEREHGRKFTFRCKVDVSAPDKDLPLTFEGAVELARNLPELVKQTNNGKGVPLTYHLMPLDTVVKMCKSQIKLDIQYKEINEGTVKKCVDVLERVTKKRQDLFDLHHDIHANDSLIPDQFINSTDDILGEVTVQESRFRADFQTLVKSVRSGSEDISVLDKFLGEQTSEGISTSKYSHEIEECKRALSKALMIKSWRSKGILYMGKREVYFQHEKPKSIVLYKPNNANNPDDLEKNEMFFMRLHATHGKDDDYAFIVVDQEIAKQCWPTKILKATIHKYVKGNLTCDDMYTNEGQYLEICLIQIGKPEYYQTYQSNRTHVKLRCPNALFGSGQCTGDPVNWRCSICKMLIEYGIENGSFYCRCGKSKPVDAMFRCNDKNHDMSFVRYPEDVLHSELSQHRAMNEMNILILGETGVGKSTWINGFQNYLYFEDLNEAMCSPEFHVLIPSSFTFTQEGKERDIKVGEPDPNEVQEAGKSATKEPQSYVFYVGGVRIRLIDTPGIGDSEGIQQDQKNVDNILAYLSNYQEIHAVCILLKPNNSRLTAMFRFCIQELLAQLHSSAKYNIVFCFTNARGTFYQPGDTLPALNKELRQRKVGIQATPHNYFCFDNEAFRFLACSKNGVQFSQADIETYAKSWDKSVDETKRLFEYIQTELKPHRVRETLSMNEARRVILAMSKPLAEVAKTIDQNVEAGKRKKELILLGDNEIKSLEKHLKFQGYDIDRVELGYPRTVCTAKDCVRFVTVGEDCVQNTVYKQICHHQCYLSGIPTQTTNNPQLQRCAAIGSNDNCKKCGHHYTVHMHLTYDTTIIQKEFLSEDVQNKIQAMGSRKAKEEAIKREIDTKIEELKEEEKFIMKIGAKYGSFLKANALIPYNDAVGDYLDLCIRTESMKASELRDHALLLRMQEMKQEYERQKKMLDDAIGTGEGENIRTPDQVKQLQNELFQLKHFGPTLKRLFEGISITNSARNRAFGEKIASIPPERSAKSKSKRSWFPESVSNVVDTVRTGVSNFFTTSHQKQETTKK